MIAFTQFTKKVHEYLQQPKFAYPLVVTTDSALRYVLGQEGEVSDGQMVRFYLLVHPEKGSIESISYQVFGEPFVIALCEALCEIVLTKNYVQASRVGADLLEKKLFEKEVALTSYEKGLINTALSALYMALEQCQDISLEESLLESPLQRSGNSEQSEHLKMWDSYSHADKLHLIKKTIQEDIEPYVALDQGGVEVKEFLHGKEVVIGYKGSCSSCFSATGATLNAINQILKQKLHPELIVVPDMSTIKF